MLFRSGMRLVAIFNPVVSLVVNVGIVLVLWFGGLRVNVGDMDVGKVMAFINYMTQVLFSLMVMTRILNIFIRARSSAERIGEVFEAEDTIIVKENPTLIKNMKGQLEFENVYFKYNTSSKYILEDINFTVNHGDTLAIIGSTGSGKSSLINLIPRFYDVLKGTVKIDSVDVREFDINNLREKIGIVPQKV